MLNDSWESAYYRMKAIAVASTDSHKHTLDVLVPFVLVVGVVVGGIVGYWMGRAN